MNKITYHYIIMAQKDLLESQCIEEILREKSHYYSVREKHRDFWLCISPEFVFDPSIFSLIKESRFYNQKKSIINYSIEDGKEINFFGCLISKDKEFLNWIGLRLGYFENIEKSNFLEEVKTKNYVSDGVRGTLVISEKEEGKNPLKSHPNYLHPDILLKKNRKFLDLYYQTVKEKEFKVKEIVSK